MTHTQQAPASTEVLHEATPDAPAEATQTPRQPRGAVFALALIGVLFALGVALLIVSSVARGQVISYQDARPVVCSNQEQLTAPSLKDHGRAQDRTYYSAIRLTKGLDCTLRFFVTNTSVLPARVAGVDLGLFEPGAGGLQIVGINGELTSDVPIEEGLARLSAGYDLQPGETQYFEMQLIYADATKCENDNMSYLKNSPAVAVSVLGIEGQHDGLPGGFALVGNDESDPVCN